MTKPAAKISLTDIAKVAAEVSPKHDATFHESLVAAMAACAEDFDRKFGK